MSYLGWFDGELRPDAWFDAELQPAAWFDTEIVNTSTASNTAVDPGVGSLSITGYAPVVQQITPGVSSSYVVRGSQSVNAWNYVLSTAVQITPGVGSITFTGYAPAIGQNHSVLPAAGSLTITGYAPTLAQTANQSVLPSVGSLAITGYAPTLAQSANQAVAPGVGSLTITGYAPTLAQTANQALVPGVGSLTITGYAPTLTQSTSGSYGVVHNYVTRGSVSIVNWLNDGLGVDPGAITPGAGSLTITGYAPVIGQTTTTNIVPGVGSLTIAGYAPSVVQAANTAVNPGAGSLAITGYAPTLAQTANQSLVPAAGSLSITGYAPSLVQSVSEPVIGVVHTYVSRGSQQVVSWLNDGISVPVTPDTSTPGYSGEVEMSRGHWYVRRGKRIYLFSSAEDADNWLDADRIAQEAVEAAQRSSRRARKRLKDKVLKTYEAPKAEVIDGGLIEAMALRYGLDFDLASLIQQRDIDQIIAMQALAWQMQDDEDIELLLLA